MASFSTISIRFNAQLSQFSSQMRNAQRQMQQVGKKFKSVGSGLTTGFTLPAIAALAGVTKGTEQLRADLGRLETNAELAGEKIGFMRDQLKEAQAVTGETDSSVEGLSNLLASGFRGEQLSRALENISGAAIKFSDTLKFEGVADGLQETLSTGAAIGPFAELLERSGVNLDSFNAGLQQSIKNGTQQNFVLNTLASQGLAEVNKKYKENNRDVIAARQSQLSFQLAMADLARVVQPIVTRITEAVTGLVEKFNNLDPAVKKTILIIGGIAAAIGPLLYGIGSLMTVLPALGGAFTALTGPIGLAVAAIAGLVAVIAANWDKVLAEVENLKNYFTELYNESLVFRVGVEQIITVFNTLYNVAKLVIDLIVTGFSNGASLILNSFKNIGAGIKAVLTGDIKEIPKIFARQADMARNNFKNLFKDIGGDIGRFVADMSKDIDDSIARIQKEKRLVLKTELDVSGSQTSATDAPGGLENPDTSGAIASTQGLRAAIVSVNEIPPIKSPLDEMLANLTNQTDLAKQTFSGFKENMVDVSGALNNALQGAIANTAQFMGQLVGNLLTGQASTQDALKGLMQIVAGFMESLGQAMIAAGTASEAFKNLFASGIGAIAAGAALVALAGVVTNIMKGGVSGSSGGGRRVALANGGIAYGPTNALIGEYAGARSNPEVVAPLDKLKNMIADTTGGGRVEVFGKFELQNNKLVAAVQRGQQEKSRFGG